MISSTDPLKSCSSFVIEDIASFELADVERKFAVVVFETRTIVLVVAVLAPGASADTPYSRVYARSQYRTPVRVPPRSRHERVWHERRCVERDPMQGVF